MLLPHPSLDDPNSSENIRASIFDACLQLGALDDGSLVAEWMFEDRSIEGDIDSSLCRQNPTSRFKEMFSSECLVVPDIEIPSARHHRRLLSFSLRAPTFTKHSRPKSRLTTDEGSMMRKGGSKRASIGRSFFKRTVDTSNTVVFDDGHVSTLHRTFFQRQSSIRGPSQADSLPGSQARGETRPVRNVTSSIDAPMHCIITEPQTLDDPEASTVQEDDANSDWEEIEAIPGSSLHPLSNEGMNPSAVLPPSSRNKCQSTRTANNDLDGIEANCSRFALPRVLFRRPLKQGHHSLSSQRYRGSSSPDFATMAEFLSDSKVKERI